MTLAMSFKINLESLASSNKKNGDLESIHLCKLHMPVQLSTQMRLTKDYESETDKRYRYQSN